eukprot:gene19020-biopygen20493
MDGAAGAAGALGKGRSYPTQQGRFRRHCGQDNTNNTNNRAAPQELLHPGEQRNKTESSHSGNDDGGHAGLELASRNVPADAAQAISCRHGGNTAIRGGGAELDVPMLSSNCRT